MQIEYNPTPDSRVVLVIWFVFWFFKLNLFYQMHFCSKRFKIHAYLVRKLSKYFYIVNFNLKYTMLVRFLIIDMDISYI